MFSRVLMIANGQGLMPPWTPRRWPRLRLWLAALALVPGLTHLPAAQASSYADLAAAKAVVDDAVAQGVDREWAEQVMQAATRQQSILDAMSRPAEKTKQWHEYRKIFMTEKRIREGVGFAQEHSDVLARVSDETGVPTPIIVAIIGVETFYGRIAGNYRVVDALSTLAFDFPKRSEFFSSELSHFLVLTYEAGKDPLALKGSYAGAMGYGQFMPSSYRSYARDFDGDGVADIWTNPSDAIASVANYFVRHGWTEGGPVVVAANAEDAPDSVFEGGLKPTFTVGELAAMGFAPLEATDINHKATALKFQGEEGPEYWMALENFYVITRYNHSAMYAMSVYQLSEAIAAGLAES